MRRGFNVFPWLYRAATVPGEAGRFVAADADPWPYLAAFPAACFATLRGLGVDVIRVPLEPSPFLAATDDAERDARAAGVLDAIGRVTGRGLTAIVDLHPRDAQPLFTGTAVLQSADLRVRYRATVTALARAMASRGGPLVLELMNEPPGGWGWRDDFGWFDFQAELVAAARVVAPRLPLLLQGDHGGGIDGLMRLDPGRLDGPTTLYSFHYYRPMIVTHQGATWGQNRYRRYLSGVPFPLDPADEAGVLARLKVRIDADPSALDKDRIWRDASAAVRDDFSNGFGRDAIAQDVGRVVGWAARHRIPAERLFLGEFGAMRPGAATPTVVAYAKAVRSAAEAAGIGWAYWNYAPFDENSAGFSVLAMMPPDPVALDAGIIEEGLGLRRP